MENQSSKKEWFIDWFNTEYYHILYKDRNYSEAENFITNVVNHLRPSQEQLILDLACGKGRHSIFLNKLGYNVMGCDLAENSILEAKKTENDRLKFFTHDMRNVIQNYSFDYIFNLFTSFAYFQPEDNLKVLQSIKANLKPNGILLIDFLNAQKSIDNMKPFEIKEINDISFEISKKHENGIIIKDINFTDKGKKFHFQELVQGLMLEDFKKLFEQAGLKLIDIFGDYNLNKFDVTNSDRLILIAQNI